MNIKTDIARINQMRLRLYMQSYVQFIVLVRYLYLLKLVEVTETKKDQAGAVVTDITDNTYDNFDRLLSSTERGLAVTYTYDNNGNRTLVATSSGSTAYIFNNRNWIATATDNSQLSTSYSYYLDGKKNTVTYPNNASVAYTYHPDNRVKSVTNKAGSAVISSYDYIYDSNGNRTSQIEYQNGVTETTAYTYDNADRMKDFTVTGSGTTKTEYTFEGYNRKTEKVTTNGAVVKDQTYTYDETDWLTKMVDSQNNKAIDYTFDLNGNIIRKADSLLPNGDMTYAYDSRNKMVEAKRGPPGSQVVLGLYDYNAEGFRVRHRLSERGDVDYYYDGSAVIEERNATNNSLLAHYQYGDRLIALSTASNTQYYHYDALGSTVNLTNSMGATEVGYQLDPWGHIRLKLGESLNRHIFTGQEHDENTGLIYFGARYYDPDTARFMTQDTYLGEAGTPPSLNRYLYAYGNPTVYVDLNGHWVESAWDLASLGVGAASLAYNVSRGAWKDAALDAVGVIADGVALALPVVPGGAGMAIKASRLAKAGTKAVEAINSTKAIKRASEIVESSKAAQTGIKTLRAADQVVNVGQASIAGYESVEDIAEGRYAEGVVKAGAAGLQGLHIGARIAGAKPKNGITVENRAGGHIRTNDEIVAEVTKADSPSTTQRILQNERGAVGSKENLPAVYDSDFAVKQVNKLSEAHITDSGQTVLGLWNPPPGYSKYTEYAKKLKASYFDLGDTWNALTPVQREAANFHFLDIVASRSDKIQLSVPRSKIGAGVSLNQELNYLINKYNYKWVDESSLIKE